MGNFSVVGGNSSNITQYNVIGISFTATTTLGNCIITGANTLDIIHEFRFFVAATNTGVQNASDSVSFAFPLRMSDLKCPTLTAASARIYLS